MSVDDLTTVEEEIGRSIDKGDVYTAMNLYRDRLGEFRGIGWRRAEYRLGLRVTEQLVQAGGVMLEGMGSLRPWYDRALYHLALGNLGLAEEQLKILETDLEQERAEIGALQRAAQHNVPDDDWLERYENLHSKRNALSAPGRMSPAAIDTLYRPALLQSLSDVMLAQGRLVEAEHYAQQTIDAIPVAVPTNFMHAETGASPYGRRAAARYLLGQVNEAWSDLDEAEGVSAVPVQFGDMQQTYRLELLIRQGNLDTAARLLKGIDWAMLRAERPLLWASYSLCQTQLHLALGESEEARPVVEQVLEWAQDTGHQESWIRSRLATARIQMQQGAAGDAELALDGVERVTRDKGFAIWLIEGLVLEGHRSLLVEDRIRAEEVAQEAMVLSGDTATRYAWGSASASHLIAEIRYRQGQIEEARTYAQRACALRDSLADARLWNTHALLDKIGAK